MTYIPLPTATAEPSGADLGVVVRLMAETELHALDQLFVAQFHGMLHGRVTKILHIMGSRVKGWDSTSILGDAAEYLDTSQSRVNAVATGTTYYIRSSNAGDTAAGTGARTVRVYWLDSAGALQTTTATLNGTTPVSLGSGFSYFIWMEVASVGTNTTSLGDISISSNAVGAPVTSEIVEWIERGGNRSLSGRVKVPTGWTGYMLDWHYGAISASMDVRLRGDYFTDDKVLSSGVFHFLDRAYLAAGDQGGRNLHYVKVPAGAEVKVSAYPGSVGAGNKLDCDFDILLVEDV